MSKPASASRPPVVAQALTPSTAQQPMKNRVVLITGATQGIGKETAAALAKQGATVIMAVRNLALGEQVATEIRHRHPGADIHVGPKLDLESIESVRGFARKFKESGRPLHVLINNAGANYVGEPWFTPDGIGGQCQVNYLAPYTLTRLLEDRLIESAPSRVVNLSSVTHRFGRVKDPGTFLTKWYQGSTYPNSKLGNAMFAFELHRRLAPYGVASCAVDPGGVASSIWRSKKIFTSGPVGWLINNLYSPPEDGATAVVHAASVAWNDDVDTSRAVNDKMQGNKNVFKISPGSTPSTILQAAGNMGQAAAVGGAGGGGRGVSSVSASQTNDDQQQNQQISPNDLRFYARGLFAWPTLTNIRGRPAPQRSVIESTKDGVLAISALLHSGLDWPLRKLTRGKWEASTMTCPVPANPVCYDEELSKKLWEVSADAVRVPREIQLPKSVVVAGIRSK